MFTFETADEKEVRRFRMAQFNGRTASVRSGSETIIGHVRSVQEQEATVPPRWTITIDSYELMKKIIDMVGPKISLL